MSIKVHLQQEVAALHFGFGKRKSSHARPKNRVESCWPCASISFLAVESISPLPDLITTLKNNQFTLASPEDEEVERNSRWLSLASLAPPIM